MGGLDSAMNPLLTGAISDMKVVVRPYGEAALAAFSSALPEQRELLVNTDINKKVSNIIQHVAMHMKQPEAKWTLVSESYELKGKNIASAYEVFSRANPVAYICAETDLERYLAEHPRSDTAWRLRQPAPEPASASFKDKAIARFHLCSPFPEEHPEEVWEAYYKGRIALEKGQHTYTSSGKDFVHDKSGKLRFKDLIRNEAYQALKDGMSVLGDRPDIVEILSDGILFVASEGTGLETVDGLISGDLFVRVYPSHTLTALEMALSHHRKRRIRKVDYNCVISWRVQPPTNEILRLPAINGKSTKWPIDLFKGQGWKVLFRGESGEVSEGGKGRQPWPCEVPLTTEDVDEMADLFFGPLGEGIDKADRRAVAMKTLMAALTIDVDIARGVSDSGIGMGTCSFDTLEWMLGGRPTFFPAKMRCICGVGSKKDEKRALKNKGLDDIAYDFYQY